MATDFITHPKPKQASDFRTRLDMQWEEMCQVVQAIDARAWKRPSAIVTWEEVTIRVINKRTDEDKAPEPLGSGAQEMRALEALTSGLRIRSRTISEWQAGVLVADFKESAGLQRSRRTQRGTPWFASAREDG